MDHAIHGRPLAQSCASGKGMCKVAALAEAQQPRLLRGGCLKVKVHINRGKLQHDLLYICHGRLPLVVSPPMKETKE